MEIITQDKNDLLKRHEVTALLNSETNPGIEQVKSLLAEKFKVSSEHVAVKSLKNNYGTNKFKIEALIYHSPAEKEKTEPKVKTKKGASA